MTIQRDRPLARFLLVTSLTVALAVLLVTPAPAEEASCGVCHPEARVAHETSVHARENVTCVSCHGGDAATLDATAAHRGDFNDLADRRATPEACASCHSELGKMRAYNLPIDQYALYQTSEHGKGLAEGDTRVAVCTDCHSQHDIRSPSDPDSDVYTRNLPATCGRCHGDAELMAQVGLSTTVVDDYLAGVHGLALFEAGNLAAPNCTSCHGVHGATPPGNSDIDKVCGSCHMSTRRAFVAGPHKAAMQAAGLQECVACHSQHRIERHAASDISQVCLDCHEEGSSEVDRGIKIETLVRAAEESIQSAEELLQRAEKVPLHVEDHRARLEEARTYLTEALPLVHQVEIEPVDDMTRRARGIGEEIQHNLYPQFDHRVSYVGLAIFWFYLLMTLVILVRQKRRLSRDQEES